jgi:antitoxin component YwqK of YwqJK toxin-antitoxin module
MDTTKYIPVAPEEVNDSNKKVITYHDGTAIKRYEGEWKDGAVNGHGIVYDVTGNKRYEGGFKNGHVNGQGIAYHANGKKKYEGEFKDNNPHGHGISYHENGNKKYEGEWENGKLHGYGKLYNQFKKIIKNGEWENDKFKAGILYIYDEDHTVTKIIYGGHPENNSNESVDLKDKLNALISTMEEKNN